VCGARVPKSTIQVSISAAGIAGICSSTELSENKGCRDSLVQVAEIELELLRGLQRQNATHQGSDWFMMQVERTSTTYDRVLFLLPTLPKKLKTKQKKTAAGGGCDETFEPSTEATLVYRRQILCPANTHNLQCTRSRPCGG
jgi:hypothetical protein